MSRQTYAQRQASARARGDTARARQCTTCGALCPSARGNPGEYGPCARCGGESRASAELRAAFRR